MLEARIFTLYPDFFPGYLGQGIFGKALSEIKWKIDTVDIREYAFDKHKTVDDTPYGGGEGMLMKADVLAKSIDMNVKDGEKIIKKKYDGCPRHQKNPQAEGGFGF